MSTYSFLDVTAAISGPGGAINLASAAGSADEGIVLEASNDINTMVVGADGFVVHSLHADRSGTVTVNLLKTSPVNALLAQMYAFQTSSGAFHGQNTITVGNVATGDTILCSRVAFQKAPTITYAKDAGMNTWTFQAGSIDRVLGGSI